MNIKVNVLINRVKIDYRTQLNLAVAYFAKHGVNIVFNTVDVNLPFIPFKVWNFPPPKGQRILLDGSENIVKIDPSYDVTMLMFNGAEYPVPNIPTSDCKLVGIQPYINLQTHPNDPVGLDYNTIIHEMMHAIVKIAWSKGFPAILDVMDSYYLEGEPENPSSNFSQQWRLLANFIGNNMYQHFSTAEVAKWKLQPQLWQFLDKARGISGVPYVITSGLRTPEQNAAVGGEPNSSHLRGLACDIAVTNQTRQKIMKGILEEGTPCFIEDCSAHIHIDLDSAIHPMGDAIVAQNG